MVPSGRGLLELNKLEEGLPLEARLQVKFCRKGRGEEGHVVEDLQEGLH